MVPSCPSSFRLILQFKKVIPEIDFVHPDINNLTIRMLPGSSFKNKIFFKEKKNFKKFFMKKFEISLEFLEYLLQSFPLLEEIGFSSSSGFLESQKHEKFLNLSKNLKSIFWEENFLPFESFLTHIEHFHFPSLQKLTLKSTIDPRLNNSVNNKIPSSLSFPLLSHSLISLTVEFSYLLTNCSSFSSFPISLQYLHIIKTNSQVFLFYFLIF